MSSSHSEIVQELLKLDPSLANQREDLERMVARLQEAQIPVRMRPAFERELLKELRKKMRKEQDAVPSYSFLSLSMVSKILYAGGGVVATLLVLFALQKQQLLPSGMQPPAMQNGDSATHEEGVMQMNSRAFGPLSTNTTGAPGLGGGGESLSFARPQSGGGGGGVADEKVMATEGMIMPAEEYYRTMYSYPGTIVFPEDDQLVYRRTPPTARPGAGGVSLGFAQDVVDWSALGSLSVESIQLSQGGTGGWNAYVNYVDGSISINKNYDISTRPEMRCQDQQCFDRYRLRESDMLSDQQLVAIAQEFTKKFGIDTRSYGEPVVVDDWRLWLARTPNKADYYFPDQLTVIFPLLIDGKPVYEEYGNPFGLSVAVDIRSKTAVNAYNLQLQRYETSAYGPVTDTEHAKEVLEQGSLYTWMDPNAKIATATLGDPTEGFMHYYLWEQEKGTSKELFVPALIFPVTKMPTESMDTRQSVVLPIVQDILSQGTPPIMPFMEKEPAMMEDVNVMEAQAG